jgi:hypothetical protein
MTGRSRIDTAQLDGVRLSPDGSRLPAAARYGGAEGLRLLPTNCLNSVLTAVPHPVEPDTVHSVDTWNMSRAGNDQDITLTLRTPEGMAISFTIKRWQVQGMATVATYGGTHEPASRSVH